RKRSSIQVRVARLVPPTPDVQGISGMTSSRCVVAKMLRQVPRAGVRDDPAAASMCRDDLDCRRSAEADWQDRDHDVRWRISDRLADWPRPEADAEYGREDHGRDEQAAAILRESEPHVAPPFDASTR